MAVMVVVVVVVVSGNGNAVLKISVFDSRVSEIANEM